jgi:riboflavin kinase/FMN adenylyltransferase
MAVFLLSWDDAFPEPCRRGAVTMGNFDGVHLGHQALLTETHKQAQSIPGPAVAVSFEPHPWQVLRPELFRPVLTTTADRGKLLLANGADHVVFLRTDRELLQLSAGDFFRQVIVERLQARAIIEGENFGFGRKREGTNETLRELCASAGLNFTVEPPVVHAGQIVSSSRIRHALEQGGVREAADGLGRPYRVRGVVGTGQGRGRGLGFPTANLERIETLIPGDGVYAVGVVIQGRAFAGAMNIGPNPTFGEKERKVEVHVIDFAGNLAGAFLDVEFIDRLRTTTTFAGVDSLVTQLREDVRLAKELFVRQFSTA